MPLLLHAHGLGEQVYLPRLHPYRHGRLAARRLDRVIVALIGFDADCHRLGMGGGDYDRTFAFRRQHQQLPRPVPIGLAHALQQVDTIAVQPWDVVRDGAVTAHHSHHRTQR